MLKLTNSFCRYLTVSCERVDYKAHVKKYSHLSRTREIHKASCLDLKLKRQSNCYTILQKHCNSKKKQKVKISINMEELDKPEQKSKAVKKPSNASYGGSIVVSSDDDSHSSEELKRPRYRTRQSTIKTKIPPNFRCWDRLGYSRDDDRAMRFKVVSYNVLAQYLLECHPYLYTKCSSKDLKWKARSARLYDEIVTLAPDILCLQEVQVNHLASFYSKLEKIGYRGVFKQKTGDRQDGCAIYYKSSVFELKDKMSVEFNQPKLPLLNRDNVGVMVKLMPRRDPQNPIVVATTHLLYNPKRTDVRLAQMQLFLAEIDRFAFFINGTDSGHLPIIMTGDFNSTPESEVIKLLQNGYVSAKDVRDKSNWERIGITDNCQHLSVYLNRRAGRDTEFRRLQIYNSDYCDKRPAPVALDDRRPPGPYNLLFNSGEIWQTLQLISVYNKNYQEGNEVTTYQDRWVTVDYMYFSCCNSLRLTDYLQLPSAQDCKVLKRLPNEVYGSDHLALAAVFELVSTRSDFPV